MIKGKSAMSRTPLISLLICLFLAACEGDSHNQSKSDNSDADEPTKAVNGSLSNLEMCPEGQRPEICTQIYKPVCGQLMSDTEKAAGAEQESEQKWKTYGNACTACADYQVIGFKPGACDEAGDK